MPVTQVAETPLVVVVPETSRYKTFGELVDAMKQSPGKLTYGSAGNGSASHLAMLLLAHVAKIDAVHVPYRGAAPAISDVLGGQTDFIITTVPSVIGLIDGGKMRAARGDDAASRTDAEGRADRRRERLPRLRDQRLVRLHRARRHAAAR